ncbi:MAG: DNA recombination protein RmuC [Gammaproteobacteria bacterium]|nr:DNA recombination protein RmuC [Gammaproteobacteria bacterium]
MTAWWWLALAVAVAAGLFGLRQRQAQSALASALEEARRALAERTQELQDASARVHAMELERTRLEERLRHEGRSAEEQARALEAVRTALSDAFAGLSQQALARNNDLFLSLAEQRFTQLASSARADLGARETAIAHLVQPVLEKLSRVDSLMGEIERKRESSYELLTAQVRALVEGHLPRLHQETANLVKALRQPAARGRWGELQLRRVVEMAGMLDHCDFIEQHTAANEDGRMLRPDLIVRLPGGRQVVVDAKTPVDAYLTAIEAEGDDQRNASLRRHAQQVRAHLVNLGRKNYWEQFSAAPEFVVMFVPGEVFFSAALQEDPALIECGVDQRVIPASPTTLIALLRAVAFGWQQERMTRNAEEIAALGKELYRRIALLGKGWAETGARLRGAVESYNKTVGTLEGRVLPQARKFRELSGSDGDEIVMLEGINEEPRLLNAAELTPPAEPS